MSKNLPSWALEIIEHKRSTKTLNWTACNRFKNFPANNETLQHDLAVLEKITADNPRSTAIYVRYLLKAYNNPEHKKEITKKSLSLMPLVCNFFVGEAAYLCFLLKRKCGESVVQEVNKAFCASAQKSIFTRDKFSNHFARAKGTYEAFCDVLNSSPNRLDHCRL